MDIIKKRNELIKKRELLEKKRVKVTKNIDKKINELDNKCGHTLLFLLHYENYNGVKYFPKVYCYSCNKIMVLKEFDREYSNIIDFYPIIHKFIPSYVKDSYKMCFVNGIIEYIIKNKKISNYKELERVCKKIFKEINNNIDSINSYSEFDNYLKRSL